MEEGDEEGEKFTGRDVVLVEFKAPRDLVEEFDQKSRSRFSSRSEAIRTLMRMFVDEEASGASERGDV